MTAQEKALELILKFTPHTDNWKVIDGVKCNSMENVKQCAIICVEELIKAFSEYNGMHDQEYFDAEVKYWKQVKSELAPNH